VTARALQQPRLFAGRRWAIGMAIVMTIALVQAVPAALAGQPGGRTAVQLSLWLLETPLQMLVLSVVFDAAARRQLGATRLLIGCLVIAALIGAVFLVTLVFVAERLLGLDLDPSQVRSYPVAAAFGAVIGVLLCGIWALAFVYPHAAEQAHLRSIEAERLRSEAEQLKISAEIARLRSQLEPHFLLNTLNAIAGLVTQNPREARRLIACLGDLLRDSLQDQDEMQTLDQEITWLKRYAEILESRHGDALRFEWDIARDVGGLLLPRLLLQPLVENAVQHGALRRQLGGRVTVSAHLTGAPADATAKLVCTVTDNGPGLPQAEPRAGAFGLRAVRRRLELKYPSAVLRLQSSDQGTSSVVEFPASLVVPA
jgi:signal transduction histidine kinase